MANIMLLDNGTSYLMQFVDLLNDYDVQLKHWNGDMPDLSDVDILILSGDRQFPLEEYHERFQNEMDFIKQLSIPIVGVGLGAEVLALSLGATLQKLPELRVGITSLHIVHQHPLFQYITELKVFESHRFAITQLPPSLIGLAASPDGYEIFVHQNAKIYGLQFHPEIVTDKNYGRQLFLNLINLLDPK